MKTVLMLADQVTTIFQSKFIAAWDFFWWWNIIYNAGKFTYLTPPILSYF